MKPTKILKTELGKIATYDGLPTVGTSVIATYLNGYRMSDIREFRTVDEALEWFRLRCETDGPASETRLDGQSRA